MNITRRGGLRLMATAALAGLADIPFVAPTLAQATTTKQAPSAGQKGTRLILLGTAGGPTPLPKRNQPASVLVVNGEPYVVDAGNGVARQLMLAGIGPQKVGKIFITHHHDDHNADLGTLMGLAWSNGRYVPTDAYGPPGTEAMVKAYLDYFEPNAKIRMALSGNTKSPRDLFRGHDIAASGPVYEDDNIKVSCVENTHYPHHGHIGAEHHVSYTYRFDAADRSIVFSGDTSLSDEIAELAKGADVLVHEAMNVDRMTTLFREKYTQQGRPPEEIETLLRSVRAAHTSLEDIGTVAQRAGVKTVVLNHFVPGSGPGETVESWTAGVRKNFSGEVIVGEDLMEI